MYCGIRWAVCTHHLPSPFDTRKEKWILPSEWRMQKSASLPFYNLNIHSNFINSSVMIKKSLCIWAKVEFSVWMFYYNYHRGTWGWISISRGLLTCVWQDSFVILLHELSTVAVSGVGCCVESGQPSQHTERTSSTKWRTTVRAVLFNQPLLALFIKADRLVQDQLRGNGTDATEDTDSCFSINRSTHPVFQMLEIKNLTEMLSW